MNRRTTDLPYWRCTGPIDPPQRSARPILLYLIGVALILFALAAAEVAEAATASLTCEAPTQYENNTPITSALTYKAYWGTSASALTNTATMAGPGCKGSVVVPDAPAGQSVTYHFAVTAIAAGVESDRSNVVAKTFTTPLPTPKPPVLLVTTGGAVAVAMPDYGTFGWKLGPAVGSIAPRIKCDPNRRIGADHYRVTGPIVWTGARKDYVVAKCEAQS